MAHEITVMENASIVIGNTELIVPKLIADQGDEAIERFIEFFTAQIRNKNTREAYARAARDFLHWCEVKGIQDLQKISPTIVGAYVELMTQGFAAPTVKQRLAGLRHLFDWLVLNQILKSNPAASVRSPRHSSSKGKTPILLADDARALIDSIPLNKLAGYRDRALIALMTYSFARITAALSMDVKDVFEQHHRLFVRLHEKGGKYVETPCHHNLEVYLRDYIREAGIEDQPNTPLFRTFGRQSKKLTDNRLLRGDAWQMVKRRAKKAGINTPGICNHTFRGTGITAYLSNPNSRLEVAQQLAGHSDPATTRIYDRRQDIVTLDEVERIEI